MQIECTCAAKAVLHCLTETMALSFIALCRRRGRATFANVDDPRTRNGWLLSITRRRRSARDDESRKLAAVVVTKKPEDDFVDPAISGKKYTRNCWKR